MVKLVKDLESIGMEKAELPKTKNEIRSRVGANLPLLWRPKVAQKPLET
jgi:hypothetical protein